MSDLPNLSPREKRSQFLFGLLEPCGYESIRGTENNHEEAMS